MRKSLNWLLKIYLDTCCYGRPWDGQTSASIIAEANAIETIIDWRHINGYMIIGSSVLDVEIAREADMAIMTEIKNPIELRKAGMKALVNAIGHNNAQEFVRRCRGTPGWDFGQWLNEQSEPTDDEFFAEIESAQAEARAAGIPDCRK